MKKIGVSSDDAMISLAIDSSWQGLQEAAEKFCQALEEFGHYEIDDVACKKLGNLQETVEDLIDTEVEVEGPDMLTVMTF